MGVLENGVAIAIEDHPVGLNGGRLVVGCCYRGFERYPKSCQADE